MRRARSIRLKFLTESHESEREGSDLVYLGGKIETSGHRDVEDNADETSSRLIRVINDDENEKKMKERNEESQEEMEVRARCTRSVHDTDVILC